MGAGNDSAFRKRILLLRLMLWHWPLISPKFFFRIFALKGYALEKSSDGLS
jgi:hypothetical protein